MTSCSLTGGVLMRVIVHASGPIKAVGSMGRAEVEGACFSENRSAQFVV